MAAGYTAGSGDGVEALRGHLGPSFVGLSRCIVGRQTGLDFGAIDLGVSDGGWWVFIPSYVRGAGFQGNCILI